jgi:S-disulfanyl-L-cysteine oxidoreductase SoxD
MKDLKAILFPIIFGLPVFVIAFAFGLYFFGCGTNNTCSGIPMPDMTPIPTLIPAALPAPKVGAEAAAAVPRCHIAALDLIGAWVSAGNAETTPFKFTDVKDQVCIATFKEDVQQLFVTPNLWFDGSPACTTCHNADLAKSMKNMDLSSYAGIMAGSNRVGGAPKGNDILGGGNWDKALLHQMLYAPDGKTLIGRPAMPFGRPATAPANGPVISAGSPTGEAAAIIPTPQPTTEEPTATPVADIARPSNPGGPGDAVNLKGDPVAGALTFQANCTACHGVQGQKGINNPGSDDGSVPPLNPIDETLVSADYKTFAYNLDLFIQHGSKPAGPSPVISMPPWGDQNLLTQEQISNLIAFLIRLNTESETAPEASSGIARPSNPGGAGLALTLTGDPASGAKIFAANCVPCHGDQGKGGVENPGSTDGTVPPLNPIDDTMKSPNLTIFAFNIDLFLEHGSTPEGDGPAKFMSPWGDSGALLPQQIADLIAYLISLNK